MSELIHLQWVQVLRGSRSKPVLSKQKFFQVPLEDMESFGALKSRSEAWLKAFSQMLLNHRVITEFDRKGFRLYRLADLGKELVNNVNTELPKWRPTKQLLRCEKTKLKVKKVETVRHHLSYRNMYNCLISVVFCLLQKQAVDSLINVADDGFFQCLDPEMKPIESSKDKALFNELRDARRKIAKAENIAAT